MTARDPLCDWTNDPDPEDIFCHCDLIAKVRADKRERIGNNDRLHAEWQRYADHAEAEKAALRAEVARLGILLEQAEEDRERFDGERLAARAEMLDLHDEIHQANTDWHIVRTERDAARAILADLRAKVKGLPRVTDDYYREAVLLADVLALLPVGDR